MRKRAMMTAIVFAALCGACGGPVIQGLWQIEEAASHDCVSSSSGGLICQAPEGLDQNQSSGVLRVDLLESGHLRLTDVDGRSIPGQSYSDGARFRWFLEQQHGECLDTEQITLELSLVEDQLTGFRRQTHARNAACGQQGVTDKGWILQGVRVAVPEQNEAQQ